MLRGEVESLLSRFDCHTWNAGKNLEITRLSVCNGYQWYPAKTAGGRLLIFTSSGIILLMLWLRLLTSQVSKDLTAWYGRTQPHATVSPCTLSTFLSILRFCADSSFYTAARTQNWSLSEYSNPGGYRRRSSCEKCGVPDQVLCLPSIHKPWYTFTSAGRSLASSWPVEVPWGKTVGILLEILACSLLLYKFTDALTHYRTT